MTGIEFAVVRSIPPRLFIISKQNRIAHDRVILSLYYVLDGSIYMAPNMYTLLESRLTASMFHLNSALKYATEGGITFDPQSRQYQSEGSNSQTELNETDQQLESLVATVVATAKCTDKK